MKRVDGRQPNETRELIVERNFLQHPPGSVLISMGDTKLICTATIEEKVPIWLRGTNQGWVTSEYSMLPGSTITRTMRESTKGKVGGRTQEIQRLIGRSMRAVVDLKSLGERTIWLDCDVIQADGGTRTTAITGSFIALVDALLTLQESQNWTRLPLTDWLAAISAGIVDGRPLLDLCYIEDSKAQVDMNLVMTGSGELVEIQATAEQSPFACNEMKTLLSLAAEGISGIITKQQELLKDHIQLIGDQKDAPVNRSI